MFCIKCGHKKTSITNSRQARLKLSVWRRRHCADCGFIFTTYESLAYDQLSITHANNEKIAFSDTRLLLSIARCLEHKPDERAEQAKWLTQHVIQELARQKTTILKREDIIRITYQTLKRFDTLASVQYGARYSGELKDYLRR